VSPKRSKKDAGTHRPVRTKPSYLTLSPVSASTAASLV
jgi:hypothetical protein